MVNLPAFQNVLCFLMCFIANAVCICSGCRNQKIQWLHTGIPGAFGHNIKQFSIRLRMQFIKHHTMNVKTMLRVCLCGKHLIETICRCINNSFLRCKDFHTLIQCRTHPHHISRHIKHDGCLLTISRTAIDLGSFLTVTAAQ